MVGVLVGLGVMAVRVRTGGELGYRWRGGPARRATGAVRYCRIKRGEAAFIAKGRHKTG